MADRQTTLRPRLWAERCAALALWWFPCCALAQTTSPYSPASTFDAYGNARPYYRARRTVGQFQSDLQRQALRGYQNRNRRADQRGGFIRFVLPGDVLAVPRPPALNRTVSPLDPIGSTPSQRRALEQYGGFGHRASRDEFGQVRSALARRSTLILATSLNAPVHRAFLRNATRFAPPSSVTRTPFVRREEGEPNATASTLDHWLGTGVERAHDRVRAEAWAWLREGAFRRAARAFETAVSLEPTDAESRIGEIFCYVSLGAPKTALVALIVLHRRDGNPFLHELDLTNAYGDKGEARRIRLQALWSAEPQTSSPDHRALQALLLWYLGEQDEALRVATTLARDHPDAPYADWPAKMRSARQALAARADHPAP